MKKGRIIKVAVIVATGLVTNVAMWYVYRKMDEVKAGVVYRRRKARCVPPPPLFSAPLRLWTLLTRVRVTVTSFAHPITPHVRGRKLGIRRRRAPR